MTDYKQLCAELVDAIDSGIPTDRMHLSPLMLRVRAALAEPEPEGPTDEELNRLFHVWWYDEGSGMTPCAHEDQKEHVHRISRIAWHNGAYCARWGNPTLQPVPVSERLPRPEDSDAEGRCWWWYPEVPGKTYGYWSHEDDAVPDRALDEQPSHWLPAHALPLPSHD